MKKIKIKEILNKKNKDPIVCLTSYSKAISRILDKYCDIILVGDSVGMVVYGMKSTREIDLDTMILHCKAVKKSTSKSLVVFDMPYKTYSNKILAYKNAKKAISKTKCDAVKLEGGKKISHIINYLVKKGIPVMGHIGLLPQSSTNFRFKGRSKLEQNNILRDAASITAAGVFSIVVECVEENLARKITKSVKVPTIGIGASKYCDGQILVTDDMIGLSDIQPKFVKVYANLKKIIEKSVKSYYKDVKNKKFPTSKNIYQLKSK